MLRAPLCCCVFTCVRLDWEEVCVCCTCNNCFNIFKAQINSALDGQIDNDDIDCYQCWCKLIKPVKFSQQWGFFLILPQLPVLCSQQDRFPWQPEWKKAWINVTLSIWTGNERGGMWRMVMMGSRGDANGAAVSSGQMPPDTDGAPWHSHW